MKSTIAVLVLHYSAHHLITDKRADVNDPRTKEAYRCTNGSSRLSAVADHDFQHVESARRIAARSVNALMTASYWEIGRNVVEFEQHGEQRAAYGENLLERLSADLTQRFGRGFSRQNLQQMRTFYLCWPLGENRPTPSGEMVAALSSTGLPNSVIDVDQLACHFA